jgi:hypothetical protein
MTIENKIKLTISTDVQTSANIYKLFQLAQWRRTCLAQNGSTLTSGHLAVWVLRRIIATGFQTWLTKPRPASSSLGGCSCMHEALFNWARAPCSYSSGARHHVLTLTRHPQTKLAEMSLFLPFFSQVLFLAVMMVLQGHCCHH